MADSAIISVPATATLIATGGESSETSVLVNVTGATPVYLGGSAVTAATGYPVAELTSVQVSLAAGEKLYACAGVSATSEVAALVTSKGTIFAP